MLKNYIFCIVLLSGSTQTLYQEWDKLVLNFDGACTLCMCVLMVAVVVGLKKKKKCDWKGERPVSLLTIHCWPLVHCMIKKALKGTIKLKLLYPGQ